MPANCLAPTKPGQFDTQGAEGSAGELSKARMVTVATGRPLVGAPARGPIRNSMQAQISAVVGAGSFAAFTSFEVCGPPAGPPAGPPVGPLRGPTAKPSSDTVNGKARAVKPAEQAVKKKPAEEAVKPADQQKPHPTDTLPSGDKKTEAESPNADAGSDADPDPNVGVSSSSGDDPDEETAETGINKTAKVRAYLEKMRGSGSKEKTDKKGKKEKKEKKQKEQKNKLLVAGPAETKEQRKEKKKKEKAAKKVDKARKKEHDKERALVAAERETKRIFGRSALLISSSSSSEGPLEPPEI